MQVLSDLSDFSNNIITSLKDAFSDVWDNKIEEKILNATFEHKEKCESKLAAESPYIRNRIELIQAERDFRHFGGSDATIKNDLLDYKKLRPKLNDIFWQEELLKNSKETKNKTKIKNALSEITAIIKPHSYKDIVRRNIQESWRKDYEKMEVEWELNQIEEYRKKVVDDFSKWLDTIRKISESMKALGLEHGLLWDLSIGSLSQQDISQLVKWAKYLKDNEGINNLCDLMGKMSKESDNHEIVKTQSIENYQLQKIDINSKEEIIGIKFGRDLENIVPQELSYLTDPDISLLFDLKYAENRLMCFEKQGNQFVFDRKTVEVEASAKALDKRGPIIICVDTSGSMSGTPEAIAKAITLLLASRAAMQKRPCYLINFSTQIEIMDLQAPKGIADIITFLQKSFHGGTDVAPALYEAVRKMDSEDYSKSDLLIVSDFILKICDNEIRGKITKQKEKHNRFYALSIGQFRIDNIDDIFDSQWTYDAASRNIAHLNGMMDRML